MKFTDGFWMMRGGVVPHHAAEVADAACDERSLTIWAATKPLSGRAATFTPTPARPPRAGCR